MKNLIETIQLIEYGLSDADAAILSKQINSEICHASSEDAWQRISKLLPISAPFSLHLALFKKIFPQWPNDPSVAPAWTPTPAFIQTTHLAQSMQALDMPDYKAFHTWSFEKYPQFWAHSIEKLGILFKKPYETICDLSAGIESPHWLKGASLNIIDSCFLAKGAKTAIIFQKDNSLHTLSYDELNKLSNQIANSLIKLNYQAGDAIAIDMPMNYLAVAIYLGIIKMGGIVVSIADSFSSEEIAVRLTLSKAKGIFTQDVIVRGEKQLPLYKKVQAAHAPKAIVITTQLGGTLRADDISWDDFLDSNTSFSSYPCQAMTHCNILFSSGTTGTPKAIPWTHSTAIKAASDAYFHQNIHADDVLAWPTNLGWMMGPWLIFAALMNQATIALYDDLPRDRAFGQFIEKAGVTMLGVVPTLVASWRQSGCMENLNWEKIKLFSSTGECSNPSDMLYLMWLANYKPVIEYCGGTEIGGAYVTSTMIEKNYPSVCTTPALGSNFILINEQGLPTTNGEVALLIPSMGLSTELLNADHHTIYYKNMPKSPTGQTLRRHGDQINQFPNGYYCVLGRADDTMNLGGIKISSAEIERALVGTPDILETAAIATLGHGPSHLIIFAATSQVLDKDLTKQLLQKKINQHLNPLFKISDVILMKELPKTASNKIMRRVLRDQYKNS